MPNRHATQTTQVPVDATVAALRVAIVGAGPSGCYTAQALRKNRPDVQVTLFDASPTPFGLVRYGIAPDHQGAKAVTRQFDRLFTQDGVEFVGNVRVGVDLAVEDLLAAFHVVVVATGLGDDRSLGIPQDPDARVLGAGALARLLNSDPDSALRGELTDALGDHVIVLGTGNVAVDVARLLVKSDPDFESSDVDDVALRTLAPRPVERISILGRCEAKLAKWDHAMLKELAEVPGVQLRVDGESLLGGTSAGARTTIDVWFQRVPIAIRERDGGVEVATRNANDPAFLDTVLGGSVITALGCESTDLNRKIFDHLDSPRVFKVGGPATGRLGNLGENRKIAASVARQIAGLLDSMGSEQRSGVAGLKDLLSGATVSFADWKRIDAAETLRARPGRCRTKFTSRAELLAAATERPVAHAPNSNQEN